MANSSFFKNTGTSSQIQSSIGASSVTATNAATAASNSATAAATSATAAATSATSASSSAAASSASSSSASTSASSSSTASSNAQEWAVKTTGLVDSTDYASKAWAIGGTGVTASSGASKEWATHLGSTVDGSEYSAKHYAQEAATDAAQVATDAAQVASDRIQTGQDATNTAASAVTASSSAVSAAASAASAASTFDLFDDRFLGSKTGFITPLTGPTLDNDGNALVAGTLFFSADANEMRVYDGSGWIAASSSGTSSLTNYNYTATAAQTAFSGADDNSNTLSYTVSNLIVTRNGVVLEDGTDYTATNGTSVVLAVAATAGDEINVVAFESFTTADMVSATNGGTFQGNVDFAAGIDVTGNATFGDNDKAIFGAGGDLELYHDAGNSRIVDAGTGNLNLQADNNINILNNSGTEFKAQFITNGAVNLFYDNANKLATTATGIGVTGHVDVNTSGNRAKLGYDSNNVYIGSTSGTGQIHFKNNIGSNDAPHSSGDTKMVITDSGVDVTGTVTADDLDLSVGTAGDGIQVTSTGANYLNLGFDTNRTGASQTLSQIEQKWNGTTVARMLFVTGSDTTNKDDAEIRFQTASAGTPSTAMTISSAGNVSTVCSAGSNNFALAAYHPTSTSSRTIAKFQSNVGGTQQDKVVIQCDGSVGIGIATPDSEPLLHIRKGDAGSVTSATNSVLTLENNTTAILQFLTPNTANQQIRFGDPQDTGIGFIQYNHTDNAMQFGTNGPEKMRIHSGGGLSIGTPNIYSSAFISIQPDDTNRIINTRSFNTSAQYHHVFQNNSGNAVGSILVSTTATAYNETSDYRLKENVTYDWDATTRLKQLKPARFNFISAPDETRDGFLAHELEQVSPQSVTGTKDAMVDEEYEVTPAVEATYDDDGNILTEAVPAVMGTRSVPDYQQIDQSKVVPLLTKALIEAVEKIEQLEARITALEAN